MINVAYSTALILISFRLIAFLLMVPVFFPKGTPKVFKIFLSLIMAYMILPGVNISNVSLITNTTIPYFLISCANEMFMGFSLGFITNCCFIAVRYAGSVMDFQVGFGMIAMFDPATNSNAALMERLLYWTSLVVFFIIDAHHMLIRALIESFNVVSLGKSFLSSASVKVILDSFINYFYISLKIAIPIMLIILITDLTLGLVSRTVPQLNIMILGLPIKILIGLISFCFALPIFINVIHYCIASLPHAIKNFYKVMPLLLVFADEKTEEATPRRKNEARKKGQIPRSKEVGTAFTLLASTIIIVTLGEFIANELKDTVQGFLTSYLTMSINDANLKSLSIIVIIRIAKILLPVVIPIMVVGVAASFLQTGFLITKEPLKIDLKKLNPISGIKRMFSLRSVIDLIKNIIMITIVGIIGYKFIKSNYIAILNIGNLKPWAMVTNMLDLTASIFFRITVAMIAIALLDYVYQRYQHKKDMRMTKQEVKEEFKQDEGNPELKGKRKQKQREMAMKRMMQQVPNATVVVTNPTHISVALKYEDGFEAPKVVAKGADNVAIKIKKIAKENEVPIFENKPLARLIYKEVDIDEEIPVEMYQAVAEILAMVLNLDK